MNLPPATSPASPVPSSSAPPVSSNSASPLAGGASGFPSGIPTLPPEATPHGYIDEKMGDYPFCPGCSHGDILDAVGSALGLLKADPRRTVLVSDIGCVGLADKYFDLHTFHGLHGRSFTYASGLKLADPGLNVFVLVGDGGCGIGGHHLINAARRNIGITVIVFNNFNFGMTGGQHSVTTPQGAFTPTTPGGNLERGLDIAQLALAAGAGFVARLSVYDRKLPQVIAEAMAHPGFALVEVGEICTAYYMKRNEFRKKQMEALIAQQMPAGVGILRKEIWPEYAEALHARAASPKPIPPLRGVSPRFQATLPHDPTGIFLAGSAGMKVLSAAGIVGQAGILSGLWAVQKDDYPITIQTGHSVSSLKLSARQLDHQAADTIHAAAVLTLDGLRYAKDDLAEMPASSLVIKAKGLDVRTAARVVEVDFAEAVLGLDKNNIALCAALLLARHAAGLSEDALRAAIDEGAKDPAIRASNQAALTASAVLLSRL